MWRLCQKNICLIFVLFWWDIYENVVLQGSLECISVQADMSSILTEDIIKFYNKCFLPHKHGCFLSILQSFYSFCYLKHNAAQAIALLKLRISVNKICCEFRFELVKKIDRMPKPTRSSFKLAYCTVLHIWLCYVPTGKTFFH